MPETISSAVHAKYLYEVISHGGIGFSPFGIDDNGLGNTDPVIAARLKPVAQEYAILAPWVSQLAQWTFEDKIKSVVEDEDHAQQTIDLGNWQAIVTFGEPGRGDTLPLNQQPVGKMMIIQLAADKFIVIGTRARITFKPVGKNTGKAWQYLKVEEGHFENNAFKSLRILNGDETDYGGPYFTDKPKVVQIALVLR